ncbi:RNA recognition motif-containing protein, putative isoform 2 [Hibiscus syriacus]|uniref:RNA recognition motif-containing protein, putative isoform 2 n=1 Tax=Hibiscus syriacus TaxID=106335 RepID=A0A6A3CM04_HIBSY|nr:RNA recognition motif-containing protein, putative isoform 2 [Hibiscus syriacus]
MGPPMYLRMLGKESYDSVPPSNHLWVGNLPGDTVDSDLTELFNKFGALDSVTTYSSRSYSFVYFKRLEDAKAARDALQGAALHGNQIKIEFARPAKPCKNLWHGRCFWGHEKHEWEANRWMGSSDSHSLAKRAHSQLGGQKVDGQPSKVLWIGYPPSVQIDEQMLHNAMILFGEIENMKSFPSRHHAFVEFRSVEEARRAKEGLQGIKGPRPGTMFSDHPFRPSQMDILGQNHPLLPNTVSGSLPSSGILGSNVPIRSFSHQEYNDLYAFTETSIWFMGGMPVCHARCVPIGKGLETELPGVVNCSARTGLDTLANHYREAIGFDIVFFLPDSEDDFASYTEFLRYLGSKNRAGVAKFDDGTMLFFVPPSEFLTKVLKVLGPERLCGVVLKLNPQVPSAAPPQPHPPLSHPGYSHLKEEHTLKEYGRVLHEDSNPPARPLGQSTMQSQQPNTAGVLSHTGVALTPDLIATLASFLPMTSQSTAVGGVQPPLMISTTQSSLTQTNALKGPSVWNQDQQPSETAVPSFQRFNPSAQLPPVQHYSTISSTPAHSAQMAHGGTQFQQSAIGLPQQGAASSMPLTNFNIPSQSEHASGSGLYGAPTLQQPSNPNVLSNQALGATVSQPLNLMQAETQNLDPPSQVQPLQSVLSGAGQGTSDVEVDKNQRYQSTLQFAANLLLQIQQKQQQQTHTPGGQGTGS